MGNVRLFATMIMVSLMLSGCDLVTETQWFTESGW